MGRIWGILLLWVFSRFSLLSPFLSPNTREKKLRQIQVFNANTGQKTPRCLCYMQATGEESGAPRLGSPVLHALCAGASRWAQATPQHVSPLPAQPGRGTRHPGRTAAGKAAPWAPLKFSFGPVWPFPTASNGLPIIITTESVETLWHFFPTSTLAEDSRVSRSSLAAGSSVATGRAERLCPSCPLLPGAAVLPAWCPLPTRSGCQRCLARTGSSARPSPPMAGSDLRCSHYTLP